MSPADHMAPMPGRPTEPALWALVIRHARCSDGGLDPDQWCPVSADPGRARREAAAAIAICATCPVRGHCLTLSLQHSHGVHWFALGWNWLHGTDPRLKVGMTVAFLLISILGIIVFFKVGDDPVSGVIIGLACVYARRLHRRVQYPLASGGLEDHPVLVLHQHRRSDHHGRLRTRDGPPRALAHHPVPRPIAPDPDLAPERGHRCHRVGDLLASLTTPPDPREPRSPAPARRGEAEANQENGMERDHGSD
jgi:hypothetical protein